VLRTFAILLTAFVALLAIDGCSTQPTAPPEPGPEADPPSPAEGTRTDVDPTAAASNGTPAAKPDDERPEGTDPEGNGDGEQEGEPPQVALLGDIEIDRVKREVRIPAEVAMQPGIIEFLVVVEGGRTHEAVFSTKVKPSLLHLALLTMGPEPSGPGQRFEKALASKARLNLEVEFENAAGETVRAPVTELLNNHEAKDGEAPDTWVFAGSYFFPVEGRPVYAGDQQDVVVSIIPSAECVVQYATETTNPYHENDMGEEDQEYGLEFDSEEMGPVGTKVKLVFSPWEGAHE
jgi:hypothetical protein